MNIPLDSVDFKSIKLVIWDLDETFWNGTISEGDVQAIEDHINLVNVLNDCGVANAICSKNDLETCRRELEKLGVWDQFVFNSINWDPKGGRIKALISDMNLRDSNVLFVDDNHSNLMEAKYYSPGIMVAYPEVFTSLFVYFKKRLEDSNVNRDRYEQYRILEKKVSAMKQAGSNEEFLKSCNIQVQIDKNCSQYLDRIYDLIHRTNQLNFTKKRITEQEIRELVDDGEVDCGLVSVSDKYGSYGIIGFYAIHGGSVIQFAFSCRTLGMGIEQYVYAILNFPSLPQILGETAVKLENGISPKYINQNIETGLQAEGVNSVSSNILFKGPCDILQITSYIKDNPNISNEVTYPSEKLGEAFAISHSITIINSVTDVGADACPISENRLYETSIFNKFYNVIFLSLLVDPGMGVYKRRSDGVYFAFGDYCYPLTDEKYWKGYSEGIYSPWVKISKDILINVANDYEFIGLIPLDMFYNNLQIIRKKISPLTKLYLITGNETPYPGNIEMGNLDAHLRNVRYNSILREFSMAHTNTFIFETNDFISSQADLSDHQNHFTRAVVWKMAMKINEILDAESHSIKLRTPHEIRSYKIKKYLFDKLPKKIQPTVLKILNRG